MIPQSSANRKEHLLILMNAGYHRRPSRSHAYTSPGTPASLIEHCGLWSSGVSQGRAGALCSSVTKEKLVTKERALDKRRLLTANQLLKENPLPHPPISTSYLCS